MGRVGTLKALTEEGDWEYSQPSLIVPLARIQPNSGLMLWLGEWQSPQSSVSQHKSNLPSQKGPKESLCPQSAGHMGVGGDKSSHRLVLALPACVSLRSRFLSYQGMPSSKRLAVKLIK